MCVLGQLCKNTEMKHLQNIKMSASHAAAALRAQHVRELLRQHLP